MVATAAISGQPADPAATGGRGEMTKEPSMLRFLAKLWRLLAKSTTQPSNGAQIPAVIYDAAAMAEDFPWPVGLLDPLNNLDGDADCNSWQARNPLDLHDLGRFSRWSLVPHAAA